MKKRVTKQPEIDADAMPSRLIGYARVSTADQFAEMQINAMLKAGVPRENIYTDKMSGAKDTRPGLRKALLHARPGDVLVVWKLDRLGRSALGLLQTMKLLEDREIELRSLTETLDMKSPGGRMFVHLAAAAAQLERDLAQQRTTAGIANAKERGVKFGREHMFGPKDIAKMKRMRKAGRPVREIAEEMDCSHQTVQNYLKRK